MLNAGYNRLADVDGMSDSELLMIPNFGLKSLLELREYIAKPEAGSNSHVARTVLAADARRLEVRDLVLSGATNKQISERYGVCYQRACQLVKQAKSDDLAVRHNLPTFRRLEI